jgi:DNA primase
MTAIDDIKDRLDIVDIVSETVKLRKAGKNFTGFCPFHPNVHTPAFVVFPDSGTWRCFGQCNEGGDIFKFVMKREGWDFAQTLKTLADRAGIQLEPLTPQRVEHDETQNRISKLLEDVVIYYHDLLKTHPSGKQALSYLQQRGLNDQTIEKFMLGFALPGWDNLLQHMNTKGVPNEYLLEAGLLSERDDGGVYDRFRNRIMIPIRDGQGHMAGFGARILDPNDVPKFLNSPQTAIFDKGRMLYGLDAARKSIRAMDQAVVVEGYLDVIMLHQAGYTNTVSPMGTALTEDQLRMVKKFTRRLILALDADAAGQKATLRGLQIAREAMDHETEIGFDVRGLLRQEARLQADIRVTTIPEGMDPDEVVLRDPLEWKKILDTAKPLVVHVMETLASDQDVHDPKVKQDIASQVMPLIADVPNLVERDAYRQKLARLLKLDESTLAGFAPRSKAVVRPFSRSRRQQMQTQDAEGETRKNSTIHLLDPLQPLEKHVLAAILRQPDIVYRLDRMLQQNNLDRLKDADFSSTQNQHLFALIQESLSQDELDPVVYIQDHKPIGIESYSEEAQRFSMDSVIKFDDMLSDCFRTILRMRQITIHQNLQEMKYLQEDGEENETDEAIQYQRSVHLFTQELRKITLAMGTLTRLKTS